jgi:hypothetical protein
VSLAGHETRSQGIMRKMSRALGRRQKRPKMNRAMDTWVDNYRRGPTEPFLASQ